MESPDVWADVRLKRGKYVGWKIKDVVIYEDYCEYCRLHAYSKTLRQLVAYYDLKKKQSGKKMKRV